MVVRAQPSTPPKPWPGVAHVGRRETLYVIVGVSFAGIPIFTKGVVRREGGRDVLYILVSSKRNVE